MVRIHMFLYYLLAMLLFLLGYAKAQYLSNANFNKYFEERTVIKLDSSALLGEIWDLKRLNSDTLVLTDFTTKGLYFLNINSAIIKQVGNNGRGPGEYILPNRIVVVQNHIYCSDAARHKIQVWNKDGKFMYELGPGKVIRRMAVDNNHNIYVLSPMNYHIWYYNSEIKKWGKKLKVNEDTRFIVETVNGGGIAINDNGEIFFSHVADYKIYKFNKNFDLILTFGRKDAPFYYSLPKQLKGRNRFKHSYDKIRTLVDEFTRVVNLFSIQSDKRYLLVHLRFKGEDFFDVWTQEGKFIFSFKIPDNQYFISTDKEELYTFRIEQIDDYSFNTYIYVYKLKI